MSNEVELIIAVVGALGIREFIPLVFKSVFRRKEEVDLERLENRSREDNGNREQIQFLKQQLQEAYGEIDRMQDVMEKKRNQIMELMKRLTSIELEMIRVQGEKEKMKYFVCYSQGCMYRKKEEPKTGLK